MRTDWEFFDELADFFGLSKKEFARALGYKYKTICLYRTNHHKHAMRHKLSVQLNSLEISSKSEHLKCISLAEIESIAFQQNLGIVLGIKKDYTEIVVGTYPINVQAPKRKKNTPNQPENGEDS